MGTVIGDWAVLFVVAFLLGSVPWGVIISKIAYGKDIRSEGSGNIGTTNAMRTLGKAGGAAVFLLDFGKGLLSGFLGGICAGLVLLPAGELSIPPVVDLLGALGFDAQAAYQWAPSAAWQGSMALAMAGCTWGHIFSPWLGFRGGKGIAVAVGALFFVFGPVGALIEIVIFALFVIATRMVSAGSLAAAIACPFIALYLFWGNWPAILLIIAVALTVIWAHRSNIGRICGGTESRIGGKKENAHG